MTVDIKLKLPKTAAEIKTRCDALMKNHTEELAKIIAIPKEKRTFANTFEKMESVDVISNNETQNITFPQYTSTNKELRDAASEADTILQKYFIETMMREDLYKAFTDYNQETDPNLDAEQKRLIRKTLEDFEKNGLQLEKEKRDKIKQLKTEVSDLCIQFEKNINEDKTRLSLSKEELKGVPDDILEQFDKDPDTPGNFFVSTKYPEIIPSLKFCQVPSTRKRLGFMRDSKCMKSNVPILEKVLKLRYQIALLMGKEDHVSATVEYLMAKSRDTVVKFQDKMINLLMPHAKKQFADLAELKKQDYIEKGGDLANFDSVVRNYDYAYLDNLKLIKDFQVDPNVVKEYFPMQHVVKTVMEIYQELLNVRFTKIDAIDSWHPDVLMYQCFDNSNDKLIGHFYLDLHPRDGKYTHAAVWPLIPGYNRPGESQLPLACMLCNFTKPTESTPSLFTHDEVVTFFHEFGHVLHNMSTTVKYPRFSGTSVERDFVECPSQLFENWCWDKQVLARLSHHYKDGSSLPSDLIDRMIASKTLNIAIFYLRQLHFSTFDTKIHLSDESAFENTTKIYHENCKKVSLLELQPDTNPAATFGHIMGGYDARYYSYMWSEVYSADIFARFEKEGVMNKELGKKLRDLVLAVGGSQDSNITVKNFLEREPNEENFLKTLKLA
eukprot:gene6611-8181_t